MSNFARPGYLRFAAWLALWCLVVQQPVVAQSQNPQYRDVGGGASATVTVRPSGNAFAVSIVARAPGRCGMTVNMTVSGNKSQPISKNCDTNVSGIGDVRVRGNVNVSNFRRANGRVYLTVHISGRVIDEIVNPNIFQGGNVNGATLGTVNEPFHFDVEDPREAARIARENEAQRQREEQARREQLARQQEEQRQRDEQQRIAQQRQYEEQQRRAAEQRQYEEQQRRLAQQQYEEQQRRLAQQRQYEEQQRRLAQQRQYEEQQRRAAEQRQREEEQRLSQERNRANESQTSSIDATSTARSVRSDVGVSATFVNRTDAAVDVLWVNFAGEEIVYKAGLRPGEQYGIGTYETHVWRFKRGTQLVSEYVANQNRPTYEIVGQRGPADANLQARQARQGFGTDGRRVRSIVYTAASGQGSFRQTNNSSWGEYDSQGRLRFQFRELNRDDWSVYLWDDSRNIGVQIDLHTRQVNYRPSSNAPYGYLYPIVDAL